MPITYAVKKTRNPKNPDVDYYAGRAIKTGEYTFENLAEDINNSTTITQADATAVLKAMKHFITKALINGQVVEVKSEGGFIDEQQEIEIIRISGESLFVAKVKNK